MSWCLATSTIAKGHLLYDKWLCLAGRCRIGLGKRSKHCASGISTQSHQSWELLLFKYALIRECKGDSLQSLADKDVHWIIVSCFRTLMHSLDLDFWIMQTGEYICKRVLFSSLDYAWRWFHCFCLLEVLHFDREADSVSESFLHKPYPKIMLHWSLMSIPVT